MQGRLTKIADWLREADVTGRVLATILVSSTRSTIWPLYLWLRKAWGALDLPPAYTWIFTSAYFAVWVWLVVLLSRNGKRYPLMTLDALSGGALVTVAVAIHEPPLRTALSQMGFGAAAWVAFICARSVQDSGHHRNEINGRVDDT
jgi:hypothetical protein